MALVATLTRHKTEYAHVPEVESTHLCLSNRHTVTPNSRFARSRSFMHNLWVIEDFKFSVLMNFASFSFIVAPNEFKLFSFSNLARYLRLLFIIKRSKSKGSRLNLRELNSESNALIGKWIEKGSNHFYLECTLQLVFTETPMTTAC